MFLSDTAINLASHALIGSRLAAITPFDLAHGTARPIRIQGNCTSHRFRSSASPQNQRLVASRSHSKQGALDRADIISKPARVRLKALTFGLGNPTCGDHFTARPLTFTTWELFRITPHTWPLTSRCRGLTSESTEGPLVVVILGFNNIVCSDDAYHQSMARWTRKSKIVPTLGLDLVRYS